MASLKKFILKEVPNQLKHNERALPNPSNKNIDPTRSKDNYALFLPEEGSYARFQEIYKNAYKYGRSDLKVMVTFVITVPKALPADEHRKFFEAAYTFLKNRYNAPVIQSIVHLDEVTPHLHHSIAPLVPDPKHGGNKICCNDLITLRDMQTFHKDFQEFIDQQGFTNACVHSGISREIGGSLSVDELKRLEEYRHDHGYRRGVQW